MKQINAKGFTIAELLIVIVVMVILAVITITVWRGVTESAHDNAVKSELTTISDVIDLKALDDQFIPDGGMTSSGTGTSTVFTGITTRVTKSSYAANTNNIFYCAGDLSNGREYAVLAKSKSGKVFAYISNQGIEEMSGFVLTAASNGASVCPALGFTAPYTWSYGYTATGAVWSSWIIN